MLEVVLVVALMMLLGTIVYESGKSNGEKEVINMVEDHIRIAKNYDEFVDYYNVLYRHFGGNK